MLGLVGEFTGLLLVIFLASLVMSIATERLAERWGANFAGSILLGLVTVLPEYLYVFWAVEKGATTTDAQAQSDYFGMALGSVAGAAAMLVTLGYGLVILTSTSRVSRKPVRLVELSKTTQIDALYLLVTAVVAVVLALIGNGLGLVDAAILAAIYLAYAVHLYFEAHQKSKQQREAGVARVSVFWPLMGLVVCGAVVIVVSEPFVDAMKDLAVAFNVPPLAVAVILSPIASEMPEKLTAFLTVHRDGKLAEISVCNFIGSKVNHNSLLLAMMPFVVWVYAGEGFFPGVMVPAFWMMTGLTIIATISLARRRLSHWQGWFFALLFLLQIAVALKFHQGPLALAH
jgi:cation:H+ antiporter